MNKTYDYKVTFIGEYFTITTVVSVDDEDKAETGALRLIKDQYNWDIDYYHDLEIEKVV
jgi:hypothetical protein